jgi:hypothetical protein
VTYVATDAVRRKAFILAVANGSALSARAREDCLRTWSESQGAWLPMEGKELWERKEDS